MNNLYQQALKRHYLDPVGLNKRINVSHFSEGYNASCGDEISLSMQVNSNSETICDISFESDSCAICTASASILCRLSIGIDRKTLQSHYQYLKTQLNHPCDSVNNNPLVVNHSETKKTAELDILLPIGAHPGRINCALLPWQTAIAAFNSPKVQSSGRIANA
jgi:nitrogen fixation NifU-like protein